MIRKRRGRGSRDVCPPGTGSPVLPSAGIDGYNVALDSLVIGAFA